MIRLLARLSWQRDPDSWTVPCHDASGRRAQLLIRVSPAGVTITPTAPGPLRLTALQVGRLRGAAREAIRIGVLLTDTGPAEAPRRYRRTETPTASRDDLPVQREFVRLESARARRSALST